jgi:hypothetical protein
MDNERGKTAKPQAHQKHPKEWQKDLNPGYLAGQNIGLPTDELVSSEMTPFTFASAAMPLAVAMMRT